ncbi:MAG: hypothetical protein LBH59_02725, partial [Planctomycetaceae bacterium]|nr:hypothetical protein [Planctomycetaceae bacterium]
MKIFYDSFLWNIFIGLILLLTPELFADVYDEAVEKDYQENIKGFLTSLDIKECSDAIKPTGFRPVLVKDDFENVPREFFVREPIELPPYTRTIIKYKTIILPDEHVDYEIFITNSNEKLKSVTKVITTINLCYSTTQQNAFKYIFHQTANSFAGISEIGKLYRKSNEFGDFCLVNQPPIPQKTVGYKNKIYFINNCTAYVIRSRDKDVTPLAQYIDKRYTELTAELNSPPAFRMWFTPDKIFSVEAKYISSDLTKVKLIGKDDKQIEIELSKLSSVDQLYIKRRVEVEDAKSK